MHLDVLLETKNPSSIITVQACVNSLACMLAASLHQVYAENGRAWLVIGPGMSFALILYVA